MQDILRGLSQKNMKYGPEDIQNLVGTQNWEKALGAMHARRYSVKLKLKKKNKAQR